MTTPSDPMNADDLARNIYELAREIVRLRESGPVSVQDVQRIASRLTRAQLELGELERVELRARGVSREMAERFVVLESKIRALRDEISGEMKHDRSGREGSAGTSHVHDSPR